MPDLDRFAIALCAICVLGFLPHGASAQSPILVDAAQGKLVLDSNLLAPEFGLERLARREDVREFIGIRRGNKRFLAVVVAKDGRATLELPERQSVALPLRLPVKVSGNGVTILQYGDVLHAMHPSRTDLFWIGREGKVVAEVRNRFAEAATVALSSDGFVAVGAPDYFESRGTDGTGAKPQDSAPAEIDVYSPEGKLMWNVSVESGRRIESLYPRPGAQGVAALTAITKDPLEDRAIEVFERGAQSGRLTPDIGIIQRAVLLGDDGLLLVQGNAGHAMIDLDRSQILWRRDDAIRLVGSEAAALDDNGSVLYLMTGERSAKADSSGLPLYQWVLTALEVESGKPIGQERLPELLPGAVGPIFLEADAGRIHVRAGGDVLRFDLRL